MQIPADLAERTRALKRLKKILALSQSDSPGEAAAALHQAHTLMKKYGFESLDADMASIEESEAKLTSVELSKWESSLVGVVAASLGVVALVNTQKPHRGFRRERASIVFVGESCKAEIAVYAFESLRRKLRRDTKASFDDLLKVVGVEGCIKMTPKQRDVYAYAWCTSVRSKVEALAPKVPDFVQRYIETRVTAPKDVKQPATRKSNKPINPIDQFMYMKGVKDGRNVDLHQAVNQASTPLFLTGH